MGKAFERRVKRELGEGALKKLELLSLLPQVGVAREALEELEAVVENFGDGLTKHEILRSLDGLVAAGLVRPRGSYAEVTPTFSPTTSALPHSADGSRSLLGYFLP